MKTYYVGMDVHRASIMIVVLNGAGKVVMQSVIETGAERVRGYLKQLRGKVYVTFEEGTQANWLHEVVRPLVTEVVVCDPRHNKLMQSGNKSDRVDAQKLAELLRLGSLRAVYHGDNGVRTLKELVRSYDCLVSDTTRGLNRNHNHLLKRVFKNAASSACHSGPFKAGYEARVARGMAPSLARLTIARQLAATTLAIWKRGEQFDPERKKQQAT